MGEQFPTGQGFPVGWLGLVSHHRVNHPVRANPADVGSIREVHHSILVDGDTWQEGGFITLAKECTLLQEGMSLSGERRYVIWGGRVHYLVWRVHYLGEGGYIT